MSTLKKSCSAFQPSRNSDAKACVSVLKLNIEINKLTLVLCIWRSHISKTLARSYPDRFVLWVYSQFQQKGYKYIKEHQKISLQESQIQVSL
jgi:hypothetical protein